MTKTKPQVSNVDAFMHATSWDSYLSHMFMFDINKSIWMTLWASDLHSLSLDLCRGCGPNGQSGLGHTSWDYSALRGRFVNDPFASCHCSFPMLDVPSGDSGPVISNTSPPTQALRWGMGPKAERSSGHTNVSIMDLWAQLAALGTLQRGVTALKRKLLALCRSDLFERHRQWPLHLVPLYDVSCFPLGRTPEMHFNAATASVQL